MENGIRDEAKTELQMKLTDEKISAIKKYQMMVIGKPGLWKLLKYEFITLFCNSCPGALGFVLRKWLYPLLFAHVGRGTVFGRNLTIRQPDKIRIGERCVIDDLVVLDAKGDANTGIAIGNDVIIARNTVVSCKGGDIEIGDNTNISLNCMIHSEKSVRIGAHNLWAAYCYIIGGGQHDFNRVDLPVIQQGSHVEGIVMEDDIWLGADVKILDGCNIGRGVIIGAGSLVNKDIPDYKIVAGSPAKIIRDRAGHAEPVTGPGANDPENSEK
jgi:acetyltransferase-like isoleucine patch superfamily enzyme